MCCLLLHQQEREDILDALSDPSDDEDRDNVPKTSGEDSSDEEPIMKNVQVRFPKGVRILSEQGIGMNKICIDILLSLLSDTFIQGNLQKSSPCRYNVTRTCL